MPVKEHRAGDYLKTPEDIAAYLNAAIEEHGGDPRLLMKAFRNVATAQGGVSEIARSASGCATRRPVQTPNTSSWSLPHFQSGSGQAPGTMRDGSGGVECRKSGTDLKGF